MGNASIPPQPHHSVPVPPTAPPAQPGELRGCRRCSRCDGLEAIPGGFFALCSWRGRWDWPGRGCEQWAARDVPIDVGREISPEPLLQAGGRGRPGRRR